MPTRSPFSMPRATRPGDPFGKVIEVAKGETLVTRNKCLLIGVQRAECPEEPGKCCREVVDDGAAQLVMANDEPSARADDLRQFLVEPAVEVAPHAPS